MPAENERSAAEEYLSPQLGVQTRNVTILVALLVAILVAILILVPLLLFNRNSGDDVNKENVLDFEGWGTSVPTELNATEVSRPTYMLNFNELLALAIVNNMTASGKLNTAPMNSSSLPSSTSDIICWHSIDMKPVGSAFVGDLVGNLSEGKSISIRGRVKKSPQKIYVDVLSGGDIAIRLNPRFNFQQDVNVFVRNSKLFGEWGLQERKQDSFPFVANSYFEMIIHCGADAFSVAVNTVHVLDYKYRTDLNTSSRVKVEGDINLMDVRLM